VGSGTPVGALSPAGVPQSCHSGMRGGFDCAMLTTMASDTSSLGGLARLETIFTKRFLATSLLLGILAITGFTLLVNLTPVSLEDANKYVDALAKLLATIIGTAWALNRYFTNRVDAFQLRVDPHVSVVPAGSYQPKSADGLLLYHLNIVNTSHVLFKDYRLMVEVASVEIRADGAPVYNELAHVPWEDGPLVEPGSWAAVSDIAVMSPDVKAIRVALIIKPTSGSEWTWHQIFNLGNPLIQV
jgi:hypothetical protein